MCDYSLEMYRSRPARAGERYETHRFASGSIGFVSPGATDVAICMACDTRLKLERIPVQLQESLGVSQTAEVTFARVDAGPHHDGLRLANGTELTLQRLGPGVSAYLLEELPLRAAPAKTRELAEVD